MHVRRCPANGKIRHDHRDEAETAKQELISRGREHTRRGEKLHTYRCPHCGAWHVWHNWGFAPARVNRRGKHRRIAQA